MPIKINQVVRIFFNQVKRKLEQEKRVLVCRFVVKLLMRIMGVFGLKTDLLAGQPLFLKFQRHELFSNIHILFVIAKSQSINQGDEAILD